MIEASQQGRVLHLALNRPEKRNALTGGLCAALVEAFAQADADPSIGAIVLSGNGPSFCAGMDLREARESDCDRFADIHERLFSTIERIHKPIVAAVTGTAAGGGAGLAANAHIVVAAPDARFGLTEIRIALWPVLIFPVVARAIGERRATELSLTGRYFDAREALAFGLVGEIAEDPLARAQALAGEIAAFSPHALSIGLDYSRRIRNMTREEAGALGRQTRAQLMSHPDFVKAVRAFFS